MGRSVSFFVEQWIASGLIAQAEADGYLAALDPTPTDAEQLAKTVIRGGRLTKFQAQIMLQGKGKSLRLGNYVIEDQLGQGGMGVVYKARHTRMDRVVALKVLPPKVLESKDLVDRFLREVKAAARLHHPNIVTAFDADETKGTYFLVMEFVDGSDLSSLIKQGGVLNVEQALDVIRQAATGLQFAHDSGVIHRDIKPGNLLLDINGRVKILDMGLARIEGEVGQQAELTGTGTVMGTVDYMSPEQAVDTKTADARSDIYSLGITLWYLLTGKPAYTGSSLMARMLAHRDTKIPSLRDQRGDVPEWVDRLFQTMVAKKADERFQSMGEVIKALDRRDSAGGTRLPPSGEDSGLMTFLANLKVQDNPLASQTVYTSVASPDVNGNAPTMVIQDAEQRTDETAALHPMTPPHDRSAKPRQKPRSLSSKLWMAGGAILMILVAVVAVNRRGDEKVITQPQVPGTKLGPTFEGSSLPSAQPAPARQQDTPVPKRSNDAELVAWLLDRDVPISIHTNGKDRRLGKKESLPDDPTVRWILDLHGGDSLTKDEVAEARRRLKGAKRFYGGYIPHKDSNAWCKAFADLPGIHFLNAVGCDLDEQGIRSIGKMESLTYLNLDNCPEVKPPMLLHLAGCKSLATLELQKDLIFGANNSLDNTEKLQALLPECFIQQSGTVGPIPGLSKAQPVSIGGLQFDGHSAVVVGAPVLKGCDKATFEAWVTPDDQTGSYPFVLALGGIKLKIERETDRRWTWLITNGETSKTAGSISTATPTQPGVPVHVAGSWDGSAWSLFVDGEPQKPSGTRMPPPATRTAFAQAAAESQVNIGGYHNTSPTNPETYFQGVIHSVRISNEARYFKHFRPAATLRPDAQTVALYEFSKGNGDTAKDLSGHGHDGKIIGATWGRPVPSLNSLPIDYALQFDGVDDRVDLPPLELAKDDPLTIEVFIEIDEVPMNGVIARSHGIALTVLGQQVQFGGAYPGGQPSPWVRSSTQAVALQKPVHLAGVRDGEQMRLYVDGELVDHNNNGKLLLVFPGTTTIGDHGPWVSQPFRGRLRQLRISNVARYKAKFSPQRIVTTDPHTLALYNLSEGQGDVLIDSSSHQRNGQVIGATWVQASGAALAPRVSSPAIRTGPALSFTKTEDRVDVPAVPIDLSQAWTFEAWAEITEQRNVISQSVATLGPVRLKQYYDKAWEVELSQFIDGGPYTRGAALRDSVLVPGRVHLASQWTGQQLQLFVNGQPVSTSPHVFRTETAPAAIIRELLQPTQTVPLQIGNHSAERRWPGTGNSLGGNVDALRVSRGNLYSGQFVPGPLTKSAETIALYDFSEGSGDVLHDRSGNGHDGKVIGATWVQASGGRQPPVNPVPAVDHAIRFDGVDDHVVIDSLDLSQYPPSQPLTVELRAKVLRDSGTGNLVSWLGDNWIALFRSQQTWGAGRLTTRSQLNAFPFPAAPTKWTTLAAVWNNGEWRLYVDGQLRPAKEIQFDLQPTSGGMYLGGAPLEKLTGHTEGRWFAGEIDEIRISNVARYQGDRYEPLGRFALDPQTIALYHCDGEGSGILTDDSGKGHHGRILGAELVPVTAE